MQNTDPPKITRSTRGVFGAVGWFPTIASPSRVSSAILVGSELSLADRDDEQGFLHVVTCICSQIRYNRSESENI